MELSIIVCIKEILKNNKHAFFLAAAIFYSEAVLRGFSDFMFLHTGLIFALLFAVAAAFLVSGIISFFKEKVARVLYAAALIFVFINYCVQVVYHLFFGKYLIFFSLIAGGADQVIGDGLLSATLSAIFTGLPAIALLSLPIVFYFVKIRKILGIFGDKPLVSLARAASGVALYFAIIGIIFIFPLTRDIYTSAFDTNISARHFGMLATQVEDFKYNVLGFPQANILAEEDENPPAKDYSSSKYNVMKIDFNKLLSANDKDDAISLLDSYFSKAVPTKKNEMTGAYKDYNVIFITAEGFSPYAVHPEITPTLYKMTRQGITFSNFYTPLWDVSTSDGEYVNCTGLIPKSGVWSMYMSGKNYMPFTLGNQFARLGVASRYAFHNHNYSFYHRDVSHTNMGYTYLGVGNGLEKYITDVWPESDLEMIKATVPMYSSADRFCAYYITVSGHLNYSPEDNAMVAKNWDAVKNLAYSDTVKSYFACHIELDKAIESLLSQLEAAGKADNTLIVLTPDHYPYGLEDESTDTKYHYFAELAGHEIETNFELYKSNLIIYSPSMTEGVVEDKPCSSLDILPTVSNLLGLEYDSRLLMGRDIFSDSDSLVLFADRSWITNKGRYNANTEEFIPSSDLDEDLDLEKYISNTNAVVKNKFKISSLMLENDYYAHVFSVSREKE